MEYCHVIIENAFLKWNDQWYKGSHPTDTELQWHVSHLITIILAYLFPIIGA